MSDLDRPEAYRAARHRIATLVRDAGGDAAAGRPVPATPGWNVHHVLAHLRGIVQDALTGNMEGAPGPVWTAAQVERNAGKSVELLLEEWEDDAPHIEAALASPEGGMLVALLMDVHAHEQDLRGALGRPGERAGEFYDWAVPMLAAGFRARVLGAELPAVRILTETGQIGDDDDPVTLHTSQWELFRSVLGRRSAHQIATMQWSGAAEPSAYVAPMIVFGPAAHDVDE